MATKVENRGQSQDLKKSYVRCAMCEDRATHNRFVEAAGGILCVCAKDNVILEQKELIAELESELAQFTPVVVEGN